MRFDFERTAFDFQVGGITLGISGIDGFDQTKTHGLVLNDTRKLHAIAESSPRHSFRNKF